MIKYENRPFTSVEDMNNTMIMNWNSRVRKGDEIYILGDFAFCSGAEANKLLNKLNGQKYFIQGNHDSFMKDKEFDRSKFKSTRELMKISDNGTKIILCHYPMAVWDCQHHGAVHLYGHTHRGGFERHPILKQLENAYNVGVDVTGFYPVTLEEIKSEYNNWVNG